jgi:cytoskeletal protein CcmA (bactofilin family)
MARWVRTVLGIFGLTLAVLLVPLAASAQVRGGEDANIQVGPTETVDDDLYVGGQTVVIEGTVNGDVYAAASSVTIRGTVNGDVIAAGQDVLISGTVTGSVRVAGQTVRLDNAKIGNSVSAAAQTLTVESNTTIGGGMNYAASTANLRGKIGRSLMGAAGNTQLAGEVGKEAQLASDNLTLTGSAVVGGSLVYYGDTELHRDPNAQVKGEVKHIARDKPQRHNEHSVWGILWGLASLYVAGAVMLWLAPTLLRGGAQTILSRPWAALGIGAAVLLLAIPVLIILMITLIGFPLALLLVVMYAVALYLAKFVVALAIGSLIARRTDWTPNPYADAAIGLILLTILELIPVVGGFVTFVTLVVGSGAMIVGRYRALRVARVATK